MKNWIHRHGVRTALICAALFAIACGKDTKSAGNGATASAERKSEGEHEEKGDTIVVEAYSDANGNYFKPSEVVAEKGDVIRFKLKVGVHNVHFLPDSNPGKSGLPPASDMLQLPDQTYDLKVSFGEGRYYFQCDPHVALGMKGHLTVKD